MFNKRLMSLALIATLGLTFSACGGSDGGGDDNSGDGSLAPLVPYTCEATMSLQGKTLITKVGTTGNLVCSKQSFGDISYIETSFADGVNEIVATQMITEQSFDSNSASGRTVVNLEEGTERIVGTESTYGSVDCVNTYDVPLPITFYTADEIGDFNIDDYQMTNTTCPDWVNDDSTDSSDDANVENATIQGNFTVTEASGTVSKMSMLAITE